MRGLLHTFSKLTMIQLMIIRYYKGLGTSTPVEGKEHFTHLKRHLIKFDPITEQESSEIDMVFRKNRVAERKDWIGNYVPGEGVNYGM